MNDLLAEHKKNYCY